MTEDKQADKDVNHENLKKVAGLVTIGLWFVLAVIVVLPVLFPVIASFFSTQGGPARHIEGKTEVGSISRAQRAYFEENKKFSQNLDELQLGIKSETNNYIYKIILQPDSQSVMNIVQAKREGIKSYVGLVYVIKVGNENLTISNLCETDRPLSKLPQMPTLNKKGIDSNRIIQCPPDFKSLL